MFCPGSDPSPQVAMAGAALAMDMAVATAAASAARSSGDTRGAALGEGTKVSCRTANNSSANGKMRLKAMIACIFLVVKIIWWFG